MNVIGLDYRQMVGIISFPRLGINWNNLSDGSGGIVIKINDYLAKTKYQPTIIFVYQSIKPKLFLLLLLLLLLLLCHKFCIRL